MVMAAISGTRSRSSNAVNREMARDHEGCGAIQERLAK